MPGKDQGMWGELFYLLVTTGTVESLCDRILLELGSLCLDGTAEEAVGAYRKGLQSLSCP